LQDSPTAVFGPVGTVDGDFVPPAEGGPGDIASNSPGVPDAICVDFPDRPVDKPDRKRSFADDNHGGVGVGMRAGYKRFVEADKQRAEKPVDSNDNGDLSSGDSAGNERRFSGSAITVRDARSPIHS
jgi:hypothetical protein